jgi:hypothetical protein
MKTPTTTWQSRGVAEATIRKGSGAPRFHCCHCRKDGKTLQHIAACGRRKPDA